MTYRAAKIRLTCDEGAVRDWARYMLDHTEEVSLALRQEGVRHEMWFMGHDGSLFLIGVMDVDDETAAAAASGASTLSVDEVHRSFKAHWDRTSWQKLAIDPTRAPRFEGCELLFEARPSAPPSLHSSPLDQL